MVKPYPDLSEDGFYGQGYAETVFGCEFKSRVALEVIRGEQTLAELASKHSVHQTMIAQWKRQAIEGMAATFSGKSTPDATARPADVEKLHVKIGQLLVERDFLRDASVRLGVIRGSKRST